MSNLTFRPWGDAYFQVRISRNTFLAFLLSLLLHALLLWNVTPLLDGLHGKPGVIPIPLSINIQSAPPQAVLPASAVAAPEPPLTPPVHKPAHTPKVMAVPKKNAESKSATVAPPAPKAQEAPTPIPPPVAATDLMSYMQAARERRRLAELAANGETVQPGIRENAPSEEDIRMSNIKRNLQTKGTNGLFQIMNMGVRSAEFSFRGWTTDFSNSRREIIQVEVEAGADLERAVVRRMIELIRKHYTGDFYWESIRLGRVVTMSARLERSAELEDFLLQEFFGPNVTYPPP